MRPVVDTASDGGRVTCRLSASDRTVRELSENCPRTVRETPGFRRISTNPKRGPAASDSASAECLWGVYHHCHTEWEPNGAGAISSTGVSPPDRVRAIQPTSSLPAGYALSLCGLWATPGVVSLVWEGAAFPWTTAPVQGAGLGCARPLISNLAQPLTTPRGRSRATRSASPAASHTLTTSSTSL